MFYSYDIFDDLLNLRGFVDDFFRNEASSKNLFPGINLYEKDDKVVVKAVMPGVKNEDVNIELNDNILILEGERKSDVEDKHYIRRERSFGKFRKSVRLPYSVDRDKISAKLSDGILTIMLEKSEKAKPKKIAVN